MSDTPAPSQLDKFKAAARDLETDDDPNRFAERLGKLVRHKPASNLAGNDQVEQHKRGKQQRD